MLVWGRFGNGFSSMQENKLNHFTSVALVSTDKDHEQINYEFRMISTIPVIWNFCTQ